MPLASSLLGAGFVAAMLADSRATKAWSEQLISLAQQEGFVLEPSWAHIQHGYARALEGETTPGIAEILAGLATVHATRALAALPQSHCWLAESHAKSGQTEDARKALADAFSIMETNGAHMWDSELHRVSGEIALISRPRDYSEAERCFRIAIDTARRQGAKLWELRAAASLPAMLTEQGLRDEAIAVLAPVYTLLPEADIADLGRAKTILHQNGA